MVLALLQVGLIAIIYYGLVLLFTISLGTILPGYALYDSFGDVQAFLIAVLLWDRFFGPYSSLLRDVAKTVRKAKQKLNRGK